MYEKIERWYHLGLWSKEMVIDAVSKGLIAEDEARKILEG